MLTRRVAITMFGTTTFLVTPPGLVRYAWAQAGDRAIAFVKGTSDQLVAIVNSADPPQQKRRRLKEVIDSTVDVDDIARFCLGRFWRIATPDQQHDYMALFPDLLVTEIASHLGEYQGVRVTMGLARASEDTEIVITTVERPDNPTTQDRLGCRHKHGQPQDRRPACGRHQSAADRGRRFHLLSVAPPIQHPRTRRGYARADCTELLGPRPN